MNILCFFTLVLQSQSKIYINGCKNTRLCVLVKKEVNDIIKKAILTYITEKKYDKRYAEKLRGYFANIYRDEDLFHNHENLEKVIYRMPLIQYRVIDGNLSILGIEKGADLLTNEFMKHKKIVVTKMLDYNILIPTK